MKRILLIATGGTIASLPEENGLVPAVTGEELASRVPQLADLCDLDVVQPMNIDSTNMHPSGWLAIARCITGAFDSYDGFVVLHGTDTMAYTAAALSYLVQGSRKPIVLTGSQQPMANPFTDAKLNLYQAVLYAMQVTGRLYAHMVEEAFELAPTMRAPRVRSRRELRGAERAAQLG